MRILYILIAFTLIITACKKEGAPTNPVDENVDTTATLKYSGSFMNGPYGTTRGEAKVYLENGKLTLALENFSVNNGPDLYVYLSKEVQPVNFISLGKLRSTNGNQLYDIAGTPDLTQYKYALIHCQQFNHLFGSAELK